MRVWRYNLLIECTNINWMLTFLQLEANIDPTESIQTYPKADI